MRLLQYVLYFLFLATTIHISILLLTNFHILLYPYLECLFDWQGTGMIKSLSLHLCDVEKDVKVSPTAFSKMSNLQYFQIVSHENAKCRLLLPDDGHGLEFYPSNRLRYFCWTFYPHKSIPSGLIPENLVRLTLTNSQLVEFWNEVQVHMLLFFN